MESDFLTVQADIVANLDVFLAEYIKETAVIAEEEALGSECGNLC